MVIPVSNSMTLDGIGGLKVGNIFKVDYLPEPYRKNVYFVIKKEINSANTNWFLKNNMIKMLTNNFIFWVKKIHSIIILLQRKNS